MWIAIILIILNILIVDALLFIFRGLDSAPKLQVPNDERATKPSDLTEVETPDENKVETFTRK